MTAIKVFVLWNWPHSNTSSNLMRRISFNISAYTNRTVPKLVTLFKIEFCNCPTRCDLLSLLYLCRQLYMFRVLTPITRSSYNCNYSFWYWL